MAGLAAAFNGLRTLMDRRSILDGVARGSGATRATAFVGTCQITPQGRGLLCGPIDEGVDCLAADGPQPRFVDASIVRYLAALDRADRDESDVAEARTTRIKDKIARLRQQMQALQAMKEKVQDAPDQQISLTDLDARSMATRSSPFRSARGRTGTLTENAMSRVHVWQMIQRRAREAGLNGDICCHTFRATGITAYLDNGGTLENAQLMAAHESPRTTKLYDRTGDEITLDEVERIVI